MPISPVCDAAGDPVCGTARDRRNSRRVLSCAVAFSVFWLLASAAASSGHLSAPVIAAGAASVQAALGAALVVAFFRFVAQADELRRKVELESIALAAGVAIAGGFALDLLRQAGGIDAGAETGFFAVPLLVYSVAVSHRMRSFS